MVLSFGSGPFEASCVGAGVGIGGTPLAVAVTPVGADNVAGSVPGSFSTWPTLIWLVLPRLLRAMMASGSVPVRRPIL